MPPPPPPQRDKRRRSSGTKFSNSVESFPMESSSIESSGQESIKSDAFSNSTKLRVKQIAGDECWACGNKPAQICHVIAKEDEQACFWAELGLINFSLTSVMNAIPLCPTCHCQFDLAIDPGFIFIPMDLQYFIQFELKDRKRRKLGVEEGIILMRDVPTSEMYRLHQVEKGIIPIDAIGGQYLPVFLKSYLHHSRLPFDVTQYFTKPKEWHGAPLASLRRAIHILGSARFKTLERQTRLELQKLRDLYFLNEEEDSSCNESLDSGTQQTQPNNERKKRQLDDTMPDKSGSAKKQRGARQGKEGRNSQDQGTTTYCSVLLHEVPSDWDLGPDMSTEEAVHRYAPVIAQSLEFVGV